MAMAKIPENIQVITQIEKESPKVSTDKSYLERALVNLFTNSIQAMSKGGKLTIAANQKDKQIELSVQDTGVGISEADKSKVFKPLFTTKAKGQGFGLAVCKRLIETQNGTITFDSQKGKGTTFTIQLPIAK